MTSAWLARATLVLAIAAGVAACGQNNQYAAPPPPKVTVAAPVEQQVTRYFEATGNTAAVNSVDLVARVQGFVQAISYNDGDFVKKGTSLFTIEPEPYKLKVEAAKAAVTSAQATLTQAQAEYQRQADLVTRQVSTQANYDKALAQRDSAQADLQSAQANEQQAEINLGYTDVTAPFDGVVTARQVSIGQLVGASSPTVLATIVQLDPIWVNFNASERDVLQVRANLASRGETTAALLGMPVEVGLQTETGYPHKGKLDYVAPNVDPSTGTLAARATLENSRPRSAAGLFRAHPHSVAAAAGAAGARCRARQRSGRPLRAGGQQGQRRRAAQGRAGPAGRRPARHRKRPDQGRSCRRRRHHARHPRREGRCRAALRVGRKLARDPTMISKFFIERPVLANVLAILMVLIGAVALYGLPIAQYPDVVPPTVQVTTRYPGASARTLMDTVALPIEQQVNGVENMIYMQSTSASDGSYTLTVTFKIGTDLDNAQVLVQNRVATALSSLPQAVQAQGVTVQKRSTAILLFVTLTSPDGRYDSLYLANYATINLKDELSRLPGVGNVNVFGAGQYSMRIWLDPEKLKARSLNAQDVVLALQQQSQEVTAGQVGMPPTPPGVDFQYTIEIAGPARRCRPIRERHRQDRQQRRGHAGARRRPRRARRANLQPGFHARRQAGRRHRHLSVAGRQRARRRARRSRPRWRSWRGNFPQGLVYSMPFDTTVFVNASIHEVYKTLIEAAVLVLIVILVFLQDWRAMLVPATTVPVTIIGAFAAMWALGFTVNFSTLFAIVLSIGIVVDDAIVVVEGAAHNIEQGMSGHDAAIKRHERTVGADHRHHAGADVGVSAGGVPAGPDRAHVCAVRAGDRGDRAAFRHQCRDAQADAGGAVAAAAGAAGAAQCLLSRLQRGLWPHGTQLCRPDRPHGGACRPDDDRSRLPSWRVAFFGLSRVPTGFLPIEDQGYLLVARAAARRRLARPHRKRRSSRSPRSRSKDDSVAHVIAIAGISVLDNSATLANAGVAYVVLKDWSERADLRTLFRPSRRRRSTPSMRASSCCRRRRSRASAMPAASPCRSSCATAAPISPSCRASPTRSSPTRNRRARCSGCRPRSAPPRRKSASTSIASRRRRCTSPVDQVFATLATYFGSSYVAQFNKFGRVFQVYAQADAQFRLRPRDIENLSVRNQQGDMIPLGTLVEDRADRRRAADQPLQSLSVVERDRAAGGRVSAPARRSV